MTQMSRHGRLAREYWETYRPQALAELEDPETFFQALDQRVTEQISNVANELVQKIPVAERGRVWMAIQAQAREQVYDEEIWLPKEPGTEHREL